MKESEIEVKILNINVDSVRDSVLSAGGSQVGVYIIKDIFYDFNEDNTDLSIIDNGNLVRLLEESLQLFKNTGSFMNREIFFRLREKDNTIELTLKTVENKNNDVSNNTEHNFHFVKSDDLNQFRKFKDKHLNEIAMHEKRRTKLRLVDPKAVIDVDEYSCLPTYLEVEAEDSKLIDEAVSVLGLQNNERSTLSGKEFFAKFGIDFYTRSSIATNITKK